MANAPGSIRIFVAEHLGIAAVGGFLAVVGLGYLLLIGPELGRVRAANRVGALEEEQKAKIAYLHELETLQDNFEEIPAEDVRRIAAMIPSEEDIPGLMVTLEALGLANDIAVTSINFAVSEVPAEAGPGSIAGVKTVDMAVSLAHADYRRFKLFLRDLERNLRLFDVVSAGLDPTGADYSLTIRTYFTSKPIL